VEAGTLGLTGDRRVVALGDFSGDQLFVPMLLVFTWLGIIDLILYTSLDVLSLASDQQTFTVHYWDHGTPFSFDQIYLGSD
jgi:integrin alpha FG-GAP repeat containing protein 1